MDMKNNYGREGLKPHKERVQGHRDHIQKHVHAHLCAVLPAPLRRARPPGATQRLRMYWPKRPITPGTRPPWAHGCASGGPLPLGQQANCASAVPATIGEAIRALVGDQRGAFKLHLRWYVFRAYGVSGGGGGGVCACTEGTTILPQPASRWPGYLAPDCRAQTQESTGAGCRLTQHPPPSS